MRVRLMSAAPLVAVAAAFSLLASACAGGGAAGSGTDHLRVGIVGADLSNVDPAGGFALQVDSYVLEFLMKLSPQGKVEPNLAESVDRPDPATYVYHLRHGVKFSDGTEMTSADVANSLDYARNPKFPDSSKYSAVKSVEARDQYTVAVTLKAPDVSWEYTSATAGYIFQKKHQQEHPADFGKPGVGVVGTGPYVLKSLDPTTGAEFTANSGYWGGKVSIPTVSLTMFADETSEALAFRAGQVDVAFPAYARGFESSADTKLVSAPGTKQGMFTMNVQVAPWNDVHVRRAVAYALNREEIIKVAGGGAAPDYTIIPPAQLQSIASKSDVDALIASLPSYKSDLDKAKQELAQSAHPQGFDATLETYNYGSFVTTSQAIAGQLAKIGIKLKVKVDSVAEFTKTMSQPHTTVPIQYTFFNNSTPDPGAMPQLALHSDSAAIGLNNFSDYKNAKVDDLIKQGASTADPAQRFSVYSQLLKIVGDDVPVVPLYAGDNHLAISDAFTWPTFNTYSTDHTPYILEIKAK
ncbi:ABC transporter substrate-binding protein [Amycolatopsis panacis]|uniref:ABC transporter substrate-binding protein n=2 Tax=Amycolatopsis panacis TaxID=2340917 RepID=A0A419IB73_9PSEU|nr:ABC transporter substrate-binding protein [Amycolatopsis panacis]